MYNENHISRQFYFSSLFISLTSSSIILVAFKFVELLTSSFSLPLALSSYYFSSKYISLFTLARFYSFWIIWLRHFLTASFYLISMIKI